MNFDWPQEYALIKQVIADIVEDYPDEYWRDVRAENRFPTELYQDLADGGWLGILFPERFDGQDMDLLALLAVVEALAEEGAWIGAVSLISGPVFGGLSVLEHGTEAQKERYLPSIVDGSERWALGVTEANAGLNTTNIQTKAERDGDEFVIEGGKQFISGVDHSHRMLLLARTTAKADVDSPADGITMFILDLEDDAISYDEIDLDIYYPERTFEIQLDEVRVSEEDVLGTVDGGFQQLFDTLNTERIILGACSWGAGKTVLDAAVEQARERVVWSEPIGGHQAIQHPLADAYADLESARLVLRKAAWQQSNGRDGVGEAANLANLQAGKAAWSAAEASMTTFGGMSVASEMGVAAAWGFIRHARTVPVSEEMIRNYLGQHTLGLPKSY
ncbi:acyl-CoA dehydrogenase [Natrarchaeobius halalkaliphilus]|uniref:Acyl-CoA dehydrogenase n=1 Tax=Natrarchaeobius halalkaliphilus TaxID=1679091 RepID=A0A3N6MTD0_9EURY|nr:acyl-CoA dehydrogenase family protein [Natrarchaeobius halalkaliphilus]RQG88055.1 acyl-CoA dehydrogenase [Natrarchaeobius halalkaliphilus]